jgi:hypothetical protein
MVHDRSPPSEPVKIAPSLLASDFWQLREQVTALEASGVDRLRRRHTPESRAIMRTIQELGYESSTG